MEILIKISEPSVKNKKLIDLARKMAITDFSVEVIENETDNDNDFDANEMTFEEWNKQFDDNRNLDEFIPEYGTTLRRFRMGIYESEREEGYTVNEFFNRMKSWKKSAVL